MGVSLWGRGKDPINKREYAPGQHGPTRRVKKSDYGVQLKEKQKLKGYYANISERSFRRIYQEAIRRKGDNIENMIGLLESRLDIAVYRLNFVPTVHAARQFVNHGHILVNGKKVNIGSYQLQAGDTVEVRQKSKEIPLVMQGMLSPERDVPDYFTLDNKAVKGTFVRVPKFSEVPYAAPMEPNLVIEFYSR